MSEIKTVQPGKEPSIPVQADDHALVRVAKGTTALAEKIATLLENNGQLLTAVKDNTAKIALHNTRVAENTEKIDANSAKIDELLNVMWELIDAVKANTQAISDHRDELGKSTETIGSHRDSTERLNEALQVLKQ